MSDAKESPEEGEEGEGAKKKGLPIKLLLMIGLPAIVLILGGVAAMLLLGGKKDDHAEGVDEHGVEQADAAHGDGHGAADGHAAEGEEAHVVFYEMPDFLVNIQSTEGRPTYLKLKLTLELDSAEAVAAIEPAMPRVLDRFQSFLRELRVEDLSGSAGSYRLRFELMRRVNLAVAPTKVRAVLIEEMLIQ